MLHTLTQTANIWTIYMKTNDQLQSLFEDNDVLEHAIDKKAKIPKFVPEERPFYLACPKCFKEMRKKPQSQLLICAEHDMQQPLYWFAEPPPALYLSFCLCSTASYLVDAERDRPKDMGGRRERRRGPPFKRENKKKKQQRVVRLASTQNFEDEGEDNVDWEEATVAETLVSGVPSVLHRVVPIPLRVSSREGKREGELTALICPK